MKNGNNGGESVVQLSANGMFNLTVSNRSSNAMNDPVSKTAMGAGHARSCYRSVGRSEAGKELVGVIRE